MIDTVKDQVGTSAPTPKKAYQTPELVPYGTVADLTKTVSTTGNVFDATQANFKSR
jgi:hypothetical protein